MILFKVLQESTNANKEMVSAEPEGGSYVFQGFIQGKDYGQFGLQRLVTVMIISVISVAGSFYQVAAESCLHYDPHLHHHRCHHHNQICLTLRENITLTDHETNGSTNSSSVAVAILVPFFALIFAGLGFYLYKQRKTDKTQYTGCSVHENNNGQATFENPMYNTNTKAAEGKVVRFDPNLNTICTMV
ncbi:hypothetical protein GOODEAATRI_026056 [Goodea atripinnis]|uniref:CSMD3 protein n=1 Tax=Goodea atripinnis TaxID=208336 RepID=A0ABV0P7V9_9TELE